MRCLALLLAIVALMLGCSRTDPISTDRAGTDPDLAIRVDASRFPVGFSPLAIGNRWRLHRDWALNVIDGDPPWPPPLTGSDDWEFEQICTENREGAQYTVEKQTWWDDQGGGSWHVRYRQDSSGLYGADICSCEPPQCEGSARDVPARGIKPYGELWKRIEARIASADLAAAEVSFKAFCARIDRARTLTSPDVAREVFEITVLEYPLYPGQSWILRDDPEWFVQATVEALEVIDLPVGRVPAYRIRIDAPQGPDEVVAFYRWWGRCGLMRETDHFEGPLIGENGEPIGTLTWDEIQDVTDINLVDLRPCTIDVP